LALTGWGISITVRRELGVARVALRRWNSSTRILPLSSV
jgi:hypothetical protein